MFADYWLKLVKKSLHLDTSNDSPSAADGFVRFDVTRRLPVVVCRTNRELERSALCSARSGVRFLYQ